MEDTALQKQVKSFLVLFDIFILVISLSPAALCGDIFFWTDEHGIRYYSNVKPSPSVQNIEIYEEKYSSKTTGINTDNINILFKVIKIYDGDSMKVKGAGMDLMIRLIGIDAPESGGKNTTKSGENKSSKSVGNAKQSDNTGYGQPFSNEAKTALSRLVEGKDIRIKNYGTDRYNRVLAEVFTADGTLVNLEMVKLGMSEVYRGKTEKGFDLKPYYQAESAAKRDYRGIWSIRTNYESPTIWRKRHPRK